PSAAVEDLSCGAGQRRAGRRADGGFGRGSDLAGPGGRERVRGGAGFGAVVVPLPPAVRRAAAAGVAAHRPGRGDRAARRRGRVVCRAWVRGGGGPPRPGGAGLGAGRPAARRRLARPGPGRPAVAEEARRLQAAAEAPEAARPGLGEDLRALALINLGIAEYGTARFEDAEPHLEQGVALARRIGRPYLEFTGLAYQAAIEVSRSFTRGAERGRQAVELAERHGWTDEPAASIAYQTLGGALT